MLSRIFRLCAFVFLLSAVSLSAQDDMTRIKQFFKNLTAYQNQYTQEKVYLHLDNNGYFPKERIWFKAYVVRASTMLPTDLSKVLYVELLTAEGERFARKSFEIVNGRTYGEFNLVDMPCTGYFEIRAFTRAMTNWDENHVFSRVVPIFDTPRDTINFTQLEIRQPAGGPDDPTVSVRRPYPQPLSLQLSQDTIKTTSKKGRHKLPQLEKMNINYFPEGGHIVQGLENRVAFKLTDNRGFALNSNVTLHTTNGQGAETTTTSRPLHEGMGLLTLPADFTGGYCTVSDTVGMEYTYPLPAPIASGCTMQTATDSTDNLSLRIEGTPDMAGRLLGVSVMMSSVPCFFDTLTVQSNRTSGTILRHVPRKQLRNGVAQVTLFTPEGEILAERFVWIEPQTKPCTLTVKQNQTEYKAFSPVALDFTLRDGEGKPVQGEFSLSVQDTQGMVAADGVGLRTDMLLCSELRGYIKRPDYYFESRDAVHRQALDLLLMVQGWRRYEWHEMAGVKPLRVTQPAESRQLIDGRLVGWWKKTRINNLNVNLTLTYDRMFINGSATTDSLGRFALSLEQPLYGRVFGIFVVTDSLSKRQKTHIALNRNFKVKPRQYEVPELNFRKPEVLRQEVRQRAPRVQTFEWKDTLPKVHTLPEATIVEKMQIDPNIGTRYTYMGGEAFAKKYAAMFYNLEEALEEELDKGDFEPYAIEWLVKHNPNLNPYYKNHNEEYIEKMDIDWSTVGVHMTGYQTVYLIDNASPRKSFIPDIYEAPISTFRSVVLITDQTVARALVPSEDKEFVFSSGLPILIVGFFSNPDLPQMMDGDKVHKGQRMTVIDGYSLVDDFFSPNYRTTHAPNPNDRRRTLFWAPQMVTNKDGHAEVLFFSGSRPYTILHINAQGVTATGQMFSLER